MPKVYIKNNNYQKKNILQKIYTILLADEKNSTVQKDLINYIFTQFTVTKNHISSIFKELADEGMIERVFYHNLNTYYVSLTKAGIKHAKNTYNQFSPASEHNTNNINHYIQDFESTNAPYGNGTYNTKRIATSSQICTDPDKKRKTSSETELSRKSKQAKIKYNSFFTIDIPTKKDTAMHFSDHETEFSNINLAASNNTFSDEELAYLKSRFQCYNPT